MSKVIDGALYAFLFAFWGLGVKEAINIFGVVPIGAKSMEVF